MDNNLSFKVVLQNIEAAISAFDLENFVLMNIFGNRIMSDALLFNDGKLALPGFFLKHVAVIYGNLKTRLTESKFSDAKSDGRTYLNTLSNFTKESIKEKTLWQDFHEFNNNIRKHIILDIEWKVYEQNPEITHNAFMWLLGYLNDKKEVLLQPNNFFFKGILIEMNRLSKVYGCKLTDTYAISLLTSLDRYFDYFQRAYRTSIGHINKDKVKEIIYPYIEKITNLFSEGDEVEPETINSILWELIKGWREFFIQYMELPGRVVEKPIELPEEHRKQLGEIIGKALERETKL